MLLRALRLFGDGRVALGRLAWARAGTGAWVPLALPWGGRPHGMLVVTPEQEDELRAFFNLVSRRAPRDDDRLAWALARFEMGCERTTELQALSDYLLALRAMLEPEGQSSGLLAGRVATLCAIPSERAAMTERVARTIALERAVVEGAARGVVRGGAGSAAKGPAKAGAGASALIRELAENLRALLRDVLCGHLAPDLWLLQTSCWRRASWRSRRSPSRLWSGAVERDQANRCRSTSARPARSWMSSSSWGMRIGSGSSRA